VSPEVNNIMLGELIGEFKGKNTGWRVLPDGKIETTAQGTGKILGIDAFLVSTSVGTMANGIFMGEVNSVFTTMDSETVISKGIAVGYPSENGGATRAASIHTTQSQKLARLNKVVGMHEYETDMNDNWTGKIWEWK
jgi:hypothetical protein